MVLNNLDIDFLGFPMGLVWWLLPGDQPELSRCMMPILISYKSELDKDGLKLRIIA